MLELLRYPRHNEYKTYFVTGGGQDFVRVYAQQVYGIPPEQAAKPADVKIPLQAHFANKDDWCTPQVIDAFEKAMKAAGKSLELFRYDAEHAFVNEQRQSVHDREAAELAWGRATEFFRKHLG